MVKSLLYNKNYFLSFFLILTVKSKVQDSRFKTQGSKFYFVKGRLLRL